VGRRVGRWIWGPLAAAVVVGVGGVGKAQEPARFTVTFLALDRGEATLVRGPGASVWLLGAGTAAEGPEVARRLRGLGVRRLSAVVAQTWKPGHVGGLQAVARAFRVDRILHNPSYAPSREGEAFYHWARKEGAAERLLFQGMTPGEEITLCRSPMFQSVAHSPTGPMLTRYKDDPNCSLVLEYGLQNGSFLSLGDTAARHQRDYWSRRDPKPWGHLLRLGRAGAADSVVAEHLRPLRARVAVIPIPRKGGAAPAATTLAALRQAGVRVYRTDRDGTLTATVSEGGQVAVTRGS
jgi:competence protein ComEC